VRPIAILDTDVHILWPPRLGHPWIYAGSELDAPSVPEDYRAFVPGDTRVILVEAGATVVFAQAEAEAARVAVSRHRWIVGFVAALHPDATAHQWEQLEQFGELGHLLVGIRIDSSGFGST